MSNVDLTNIRTTEFGVCLDSEVDNANVLVPVDAGVQEALREMVQATADKIGCCGRGPRINAADPWYWLVYNERGPRRAKTPQEAMQQMNSTLNAIEDAHSGVPKAPDPTMGPEDGRRYPAEADNMRLSPDGSITARSKLHTTTYGSDGSITVVDRKTGAIVYQKSGGRKK